jgi:alkylation response protein AidB-like acyl-CoA dehydrogenase
LGVESAHDILVASTRLARGDGRRIAAFAQALELIVSEEKVMRTDAGWTVDGHKIFWRMSTAATEFSVAVTYEHPDGGLMYGYAQVPRDRPGVVIHEDWDALDMRASGSNSVSFHDVQLPADALRGGFPAGQLTAGYMERNLTAGLFHASASIGGIAEAAHRTGVARRTTSQRALVLAAENAIEPSAVRARRITPRAAWVSAWSTAACSRRRRYAR